MQYVLAVLGIACLIYGVSIFLAFSGTPFFVIWFVLGGTALMWGLALHTGAWFVLPHALRVGAWALAGTAVGGCVLLSTLIMAEAQATPPADLDYLIVLGSQVRKSGPALVTRFRLDAAYDYLLANPGTVCIVTGGQGSNEPWPEGDGMGRYLEERGIPSERIIRERTSTTTLENIGNAWALVEDKGASVGIVSNDFHLFRAVRTARKLGIERACGVSGGSVPWYLPNNLLRECLGVAKDLAVGNIAL